VVFLFKIIIDITLLNGECVVNESMLTGESIPVIKNSIPIKGHEIYSIDHSKNFTLYAGIYYIY
jgi:cation-transporting P-type ATPase 13A2